MLTIFEYLRKRACESIVSGVQDALESLERNGYTGDQVTGSTAEASSRPGADASELEHRPDPNSASEDTRLLEGKAASEDLPPPRRRGRPPKKKRSS